MLDHPPPAPGVDAPSLVNQVAVRSEPGERIDPRALRAWRVSGAMTSALVLLGALGTSIVLWRLDLAWSIVSLPLALTAIVGIVLVWLVPSIRWRRWRYAVTEREVELQHGVLIVTRTLVPMARVQHVDTRQGPILRHYGLATVEIATAAGTQQIPALSVEVADALRNRIAEFAGVAEDV